MKFPRNIWLCVVLFLSISVYAQTNIDFELTTPGTYTASNAVSGWTISSQTNTSGCNSSTLWTPGSNEFSIVTTPILSFPTIGLIPNSPLGGSNIALLNNTSANGNATRLVQTFSVNNSNTLFQFAFAGIWEDGGHSCCAQSAFKVKLYDGSGNLISCPSFSLGGVGCPNVPSYSVTSGTSWTNWQVHYVDFTPFLGTNITIEVIVNDCYFGDHFSTVLFDAKVGGSLSCLNCLSVGVTSSTLGAVNFCSGSSIATIAAPFGYAQYSWLAPSAYPISVAQSSVTVLTLTNAVAGNVYTLTMVSPGGNCTFTQTFTLNPTSVGIIGLGATPSCLLGSSGSATVVGGGSGSGYTYTWINSTNSVVSTSSVANNLPAGVYSVSVHAAGSQSTTCGTATATTTVSTLPTGVTSIVKLYCPNGNTYLSYPGGSNYQWYNNLTAIPGSSGGNASSLTVTSPANNQIYTLTYQNPYGCHDSLRINLIATIPGSLGVSYNSTICPGATNGNVVLSMGPAIGAPFGLNTYSVFSTGTTTPYSASLVNSSATTFSLNNLSAGGTYSVTAFDGLCNYAINFSVTSFAYNFSLTANPSATVCSGNPIIGGINLSSPLPCTFSWSPTTFLANNLGMFQYTTITPTAPPGSFSTIVYTVVVTPNSINCPLTKTLSITAANFLPPVISPLPSFCNSSPNYSIQTNPSGGTFLSGLTSCINANNGVLTPSLAAIGINTFTYVLSAGSCSSTSTSSFFVNAVNLSVSSSPTIFCGQSTTLTATGANTYLWNNSMSTSSIVVSPITSTSYVVIGTNTTNLCSKSNTVTVTVTPSLVITVVGSSSLCSGRSLTLTANGANTYLWNNSLSSPSIVVSPINTSSYSVTGTDLNGCSNYTSKTITVYPSPTLTVSGDFTICPGIQSSLTATGAQYYSWSNGATTPVIFINPTITSIYTVTGSDYRGCSDSRSVTVETTGCVGMKKLATEHDLKIYPNPTSGNLSLNIYTECEVQLMNTSGELLLSKSYFPGTYNLNLSNLPAGIYFLEVRNTEGLNILKILKTD